MRSRVLISIALTAALTGSFVSSAAVDGQYSCSDSDVVAVDGPLTPPVGPTCSFVISCPTNTTACSVSALARVSGLGVVGVELTLASFSSTPTSPEWCAGVGSCFTPIAGVILSPGQEASAHARFSAINATAVTRAAALVEIELFASRSDV